MIASGKVQLFDGVAEASASAHFGLLDPTSSVPSLTCRTGLGVEFGDGAVERRDQACSIFIASSVTSFWPLVTASPAATSTAMMRPGHRRQDRAVGGGTGGAPVAR